MTILLFSRSAFFVSPLASHFPNPLSVTHPRLSRQASSPQRSIRANSEIRQEMTLALNSTSSASAPTYPPNNSLAVALDPSTSSDDVPSAQEAEVANQEETMRLKGGCIDLTSCVDSLCGSLLEQSGN